MAELAMKSSMLTDHFIVIIIFSLLMILSICSALSIYDALQYYDNEIIDSWFADIIDIDMPDRIFDLFIIDVDQVMNPSLVEEFNVET